MFQDRQLSVLSEHLLGHVLRLLSIFVHVLEDAHPVLPSTKIPVPPSLSPIKRKGRMDITETRGMSPVKIGADKEDKMEEKKSGRGVPLGLFANLPHYVKIHDMVKSAYTNYKITLDCGASEKFISLLRTTLEALSQLLEIASLHEAGRVAEEILAYMRLTISIEPTSTVKCVQQLLKSLFGTNLSARWEEEPDKRPQLGLNSGGGFYNTCLQVPYKHLTDYVSSASSTLDHISPWLNFFYKKGERKASTVFKSVNRGADKTALASYIRLFEPMVIKALKQYTVTSDVQLQCRVLLLLIQLVQLRVNYCLLDSDQIFIGFVLKQFEFIEEGQIPQPEELVPRIFYFLVHLSYEKHHSKCIIGVPKVIQLCDELMASGQPPVSHCIQALVPVVEDVFLVRGTTGSTADLKDLDTQREFLVSMLLRLVEYHQVLELLGLVLSESRQGCDWEERWRRWSRQVMDTLLPLLAKGRVQLESRAAQLALHRLLAAASPCVLRPVDPLLKVLLSDPLHLHSSLVGVQRWLGMVLAVLSVLVAQGKEEVVLARLEELGLSVPSPEMIYQKESRDPLNATQSSARLPPDQVLARMLLRVLGVVSSELHTCILNPVSGEDWNYLHEQFSVFLLYCIHMFQSGSYCRVANATMLMIQSEGPESLPMADVNTHFLELSTRCPLLTFLWCYLLTLLNYSDQGFWAQVLRTQPHQLLLNQRSPKSSQPSPCINLEVVRKGGTILYCDYVCENLNDAEQLSWLLVNHTEEIVALSTEPPVQELIAAVHRNSAASGLLVQAVGSKCQDLKQPSFVCRLLRCLEGVHPSQSGALLMLLVPRLLGSPQLAPARLAGALACRRAELLLTLSEEEVHSQLTRADLDKVLESLHGSGLTNKHSGLLILLHKLGNQFFNMAAADADKGRVFSPASVRSIQVNKAWFLAHVRHRCCQREYSGLESAQMLSKLDYDDILSVLSCKDFNPGILQDCFKLATELTLQEYQKAPAYYSDTPSFIPAEETLSRLESPLYRASRLCLLQHVANIRALLPVPHQVYCPVGRQASAKELKYSHDLEQLLMDSTLWDLVFLVAPAVTTYLHSLTRLGGPCLAQEARDDLAKFAVLCLEAVLWLVSPARLATSDAPQPSHLQAGLCCANAVLKEPNLSTEVGHGSRILSACGAVYRLVQFLLPGDQLPTLSDTGLSQALDSPDTASAALACYQMGTLVLWLERTKLRMDNIPTFLAAPIKSLIVTLSRMPLVNSYVATPPEAWRQGWTVELGGPSRTTVPPLPVEYLQDIDLLHQLIFRVTLLGWTSRQQFEETWMSLLSVLSLNPCENTSPEETALLVQASSLAVQAITALLVQTLLLPMPGDPNTSQLVHQPRDKPLPSSSVFCVCGALTVSDICLSLLIPSFSDKLRIIHKLLFWRLQDQELLSADAGKLDHVFQRGNLERLDAPCRYGYSQVSLEYLWTATRILDPKDSTGSAATGKVKLSVSKACLEREQCLAASGLDLHSCLHFLLDLYSQWTLPQSGTPLRLVKEAITSVLSISDLFTERAQFQWMLETFLELSRSHPSEDEILHQYLVLGCCKAASVLGVDAEVHERIKKLVEGGLKSAFLPSRIAALHGLLYLLQGGTLLGSDHMLQILPLAIEYIQRHIDARAG
uniref:Huntingtin n=1 Tax=Timema genevievae TaxID=629358 RepID=A0A7R9PL48_TIMGE|nr:unnamed protein product [Timema genevievae]